MSDVAWIRIAILFMGVLYCGGENSFSNLIVSVNEDVGIGTEIIVLPIGIGAGRTQDGVTILTGNKNQRFAVNQDGVVYVSRFLDYGVDSMYVLTIGVCRSIHGNHNVTLTIHVLDVENWPPYYNESCQITDGNGKHSSGFLYDVLSGKGDNMLTFVSSRFDLDKLFMADSYNGECYFDIYFSTRTGSSINIGGVNEFQIECDLIDVSFQAFSPNNSALSGSPFIDSSWVDASNPESDDIIIVVARFSNMANIAVDVPCELNNGHESLMRKRFQMVPAVLRLCAWVITNLVCSPLHLGCPTGKYGFKCENECICQNDASCHGFNGACKCQFGWTGPACDIEKVALEVRPQIQEVVYGVTVNFFCVHKNIEVIDHHYDVVWYRNGQVLDEDDVSWLSEPARSRLRITMNPDAQSTLMIYPVIDRDSGIYKCEIHGMDGKIYNNTGKLVVTGCGVNKWGLSCQYECNCVHSATCDRYNGCSCLSGWNGTTCQQDIQTPVFEGCPVNIDLHLKPHNSQTTATWKEPTVIDNSDRVNVTANHRPGDGFSAGEYDVIYEAVDEDGNVGTCVFTVNVTKTNRGISLSVLGIITSLVVLVFALLCVIGPYVGYKYRLEIQTLVADRFRIYEDDDGRKYDAFVSVKGNSPEEVFVYRTLLPTLEKKYNYKLCYHHRDFIVGDAIVDNIIQGIEESRRTLLILSPAFAESVWCEYELHFAHQEMVALKQKLIPIMFDDITHMENMRPSLRSILKTVVYISWPKDGNHKNVDKFWKRLIKAMPEKARKEHDDNKKISHEGLGQRLRHFCCKCTYLLGRWTNINGAHGEHEHDVHIPLIQQELRDIEEQD
ncbi:uncharacterized protein LOC100367428 [Saccoglossus kowalevskii]